MQAETFPSRNDKVRKAPLVMLVCTSTLSWTKVWRDGPKLPLLGLLSEQKITSIIDFPHEQFNYIFLIFQFRFSAFD